MTDAHWALLERYHWVINRKLRRQGLEPVTMGKLIGAMISVTLSHHDKDILEAKAEEHLGGVQGRGPAQVLADLLGPGLDR